MNLQIKVVVSSTLFLIASYLQAETIGTTPSASAIGVDGAAGGVRIFVGSPLFTAAGNAVSFSHLRADNNEGNILTPLLFLKSGSDTYTLTGIGQEVLVSPPNFTTYSNAFVTKFGSDAVNSNYTFGFYDGSLDDFGSGVVPATPKAGSVAYEDVGGNSNTWAFTGGGTGITSMNIGTVFQVVNSNGGDGSVGNPYRMFGEPSEHRTYQMNMTAVSIPEPSGVILLVLGAIGLGIRRR